MGIFALAGGHAAGSQSIAVTANSGAAGNNLTFSIVEGTGVGAAPTVTNTGSVYTIHVDDSLATSISAIATSDPRYHGCDLGHDDQHRLLPPDGRRSGAAPPR